MTTTTELRVPVVTCRVCATIHPAILDGYGTDGDEYAAACPATAAGSLPLRYTGTEVRMVPADTIPAADPAVAAEVTDRYGYAPGAVVSVVSSWHTRYLHVVEPCGCEHRIEEALVDMGHGDHAVMPCRDHMDEEERAALDVILAEHAARAYADLLAACHPAAVGDTRATDPWTEVPF